MATDIKLPVRPLLNPLTDDDRIAIEHVLSQLPLIEDLLARAEACGLDVSERKEKHEVHKVIAQRLHTHFFPPTLPAVQE